VVDLCIVTGGSDGLVCGVDAFPDNYDDYTGYTCCSRGSTSRDLRGFDRKVVTIVLKASSPTTLNLLDCEKNAISPQPSNICFPDNLGSGRIIDIRNARVQNLGFQLTGVPRLPPNEQLFLYLDTAGPSGTFDGRIYVQLPPGGKVGWVKGTLPQGFWANQRIVEIGEWNVFPNPPKRDSWLGTINCPSGTVLGVNAAGSGVWIPLDGIVCKNN
jgi:hypothetical protein